VFTFLRKMIDKHREVIDPAHPKDLIDIYLIEKDKLQDEDQVSLGTFLCCF